MHCTAEGGAETPTSLVQSVGSFWHRWHRALRPTWPSLGLSWRRGEPRTAAPRAENGGTTNHATRALCFRHNLREDPRHVSR